MQYTVLVVDDEENQRQALIKRVKWSDAGFEVIGEAENGVEALELVESLEPDLIITDIKMPMISGLELAARVRQIRPITQIVILSGYDRFEYAQAAIQYNIISYLLKPISSEELSSELFTIHDRMDERLHKILSPKVADLEDALRKLSVTEFLLPLMLGSAEAVPNEAALRSKAEELGIIEVGTEPHFCVIISKYKDKQKKHCTNNSHIDFVQNILSNYLHTESFFAYGRIVTLAVLQRETRNQGLELPLREIVQSAKRVLSQSCTIGVSRCVDTLSNLSTTYLQAVTARRYTSDGDSEVRFIDDQEHYSPIELDRVEKNVFKLEQLLKVGSSEKLESFLNGLYDNSSPGSADLLVIQIVSTVYRAVSAASDKSNLSQLIATNPIFKRMTSYSSESVMKNDLIELCMCTKDIISNCQKRDTELLCDKVIDIIDEEYANEELSLTGVSEKLCVSPNYLSALIKKTTKKNFVTLVTEKRMKVAHDLLVCTTMKILEVAQRCGYSDQHYFSYCFKKFYGESPNKIRASVGENSNEQ